MKKILAQVFQEDKFSVCVKDADGKVLMQNHACSKICGDYENKVCDVGCMALYAKDQSQQWRNWGSRVYHNRFVHNAYYDISMLCSEDYLITFLQPLKAKYELALAYYKDKDLSRRELEITAYLVQGLSNQEICEQLSIAKSTLKTHLNNIYRKMHDLGEKPRYLPQRRRSK